MRRSPKARHLMHFFEKHRQATGRESTGLQLDKGRVRWKSARLSTSRSIAHSRAAFGFQENSLCHQQRRKHLLPIFFAHFRLSIGRHTRLGFEPITAFRAGPKIKNQMLINEFRPIRSNQRLTTFGTRRSHGYPPLLILVLRFASGEFFSIVTVAPPTRRSALIQIKTGFLCTTRCIAVRQHARRTCCTAQSPATMQRFVCSLPRPTTPPKRRYCAVRRSLPFAPWTRSTIDQSSQSIARLAYHCVSLIFAGIVKAKTPPTY